MAMKNWTGAIQGTLLKQDYLLKKADFELAKYQLRDGEITQAQYDEREAAFRKVEADFKEFWKGFGTQIKYGAVAEFGKNKELLRDLLMFYSSTQEKNVTLAEYVYRMPENQKYIYYATGASLSKIGSLPQLERLKSAGFEVLFLTEGVDEFVLQILGKH